MWRCLRPSHRSKTSQCIAAGQQTIVSAVTVHPIADAFPVHCHNKKGLTKPPHGHTTQLIYAYHGNCKCSIGLKRLQQRFQQAMCIGHVHHILPNQQNRSKKINNYKPPVTQFPPKPTGVAFAICSARMAASRMPFTLTWNFTVPMPFTHSSSGCPPACTHTHSHTNELTHTLRLQYHMIQAHAQYLLQLVCQHHHCCWWLPRWETPMPQHSFSQVAVLACLPPCH